MNFDPKAIRRALMIAKDLAVKIDPGFAVHNLPMPPQGVPLERNQGGPIKTIEGDDHKRNLSAFMKDAHPSLVHKNGEPVTLYHSGTFDEGTDRVFDTSRGAHFGTKNAALDRISGKFIEDEVANAKVHKEWDPELKQYRFYVDDDMFPNAPSLGFSSDENARLWISGEVNQNFDMSDWNPNITAVHLNIKNPKRIKDQGQNWAKAIEQAKKEGHDGIVYQNEVEDKGKDSYIAFHPTQIKSAVGNVGTFDPTDPDITKAEGGGVRPDLEYQGGHVPASRDYGAPAHNLTAIYPEDIYGPKGALYYGGGGDPEWRAMDRQTMSTLHSVRGKPDAPVKIYRAVPNKQQINDINVGDWVTINPKYAQMHGESSLRGDYKVISKTVPAKDIVTSGDSIHEWGYNPEDKGFNEGGAVEDDDMPARKLNSMGMYSAAAEAARNLPQERGTLQQMLATMKGVKPDEIDWSGVQQKFAGQKTVTRDELAQHFENNAPPIKENIATKFAAYTVPGGQNYQEFVLHMPKEDVAQTYPGEVMHFRSSHWSEPNVIAHLRTKDRRLPLREKLPKPDTQIDIALREPTEPRRTVSAWTTQTPGLAVTKSLDEKGLYNVTHIGSGLATNTQVGSLPFHQAMDAARRLGEYYNGWTSPGDEIKAQLQQKLPEIKNIISSSVNRNAMKALHLEELQSDWAQQGRDHSFVDSEKVKKANAELENYRQSMRDEYEKSLIDRLQKGQPIKDEEKEQMLAGQYKDLYDHRNSFEKVFGAKLNTGNEYEVTRIFPHVRELPLENDEKGLFLYDHNRGEWIDDERLSPESQIELARMRKAFDEIQNFEKYAKENPEWLAENVGNYVYGLDPKIIARHLGDHAFAKHVRMTDDLYNMLKGIDEGPFVTSTNQWTDLGLKRALVEAARGNYDKLIWTPGKEQANRYKLNNFLDNLRYTKIGDNKYEIVGSKGKKEVYRQTHSEKELPGVVGQEIAKKIMAMEGSPPPEQTVPPISEIPEEILEKIESERQEGMMLRDAPSYKEFLKSWRSGSKSRVLSGLDLNVGGRGMYEYYDKILPRRLLALAQEHDPEAKILPTSNTVGKLNKFPSLDITPRMRQSILKRGFKMFARGGAVQKHLFDQAIEPAQVNVPEMDSQKTIRRALMIAKQEGGGIKGKTMRGSELQKKMARAGQEPVRFSELKSSVPFPEMQAQYVSKQSLSPFAGLNPEQLQREGAVIIPAVGDRSMAGQILTHIGEIPLTKPIDLQGGAEFQRSEFEPAVWASQKGIISRIARKAAYAGKEGAPVYMSHVAMGYGGADASHMMVQALLRQIPSLKISKQAKNKFNQKIQEIDGLEEFPGVHKPEQAEAFLMGKSMNHRKAFAEEMDKKRWLKENFPDVAQTRFAITEPRLMTAKTGATGFSFGRIDPAFEAIKDPERKHESYDTQLKGAGYAGGLTSQVPMSVMFPDWYAQQSKQTQADPVLSLYSLTRQLPTQQASQEWLDQLMSHLENMPEKWGYKKGGKVGKK